MRLVQDRTAAAREAHRDRIDADERFCSDARRGPAQVGLAWVASGPGVTAVIARPGTIDQLDGAIAALDTSLTDDEFIPLDEVFPAIGQGGPGPGAWIT